MKSDASTLRVTDWHSYAYLLNGEGSLVEDITGTAGASAAMQVDGAWKNMTHFLHDYRQEHHIAPIPLASVIVESALLTPDLQQISVHYEQRLAEGLRMALLHGAPWVVISGSTEECSMARTYLTRLRNPAEVVFPSSYLAQLPDAVRVVATKLKESMATAPSLLEWLLQHATIPSLHSQEYPEASTEAASQVTLELFAAHLVTELEMSLNVSVPAPPHARDHGKAAEYSSVTDLTSHPRLLTDAEGVSFILPGIVVAEIPATPSRTRPVEVFYDMMLRTILDHRRHNRRHGQAHQHEGRMWWLQRPYGVVVVANVGEQQRVKLVYAKALRETAKTVTETLQRLARLEVTRRLLGHLKQASPSVKEELRHRTHGEDFRAVVVPPARVLVDHSPTDYNAPPPLFQWLPFTGELPEGTNENCNFVLRYVATYSHYIYEHYRQLSMIYSYDFTEVASEMKFSKLLDDIGDNRISLRDIIHTFV